VEGSCEDGNELSGSIKFWEILQWLYNWQLLKKGVHFRWLIMVHIIHWVETCSVIKKIVAQTVEYMYHY
jgi:hypothetical protein